MPTSRRVELPDGTIYDGELDDEFLFHGKGVLKMKDGGEYSGEWEKGAHHGEGKLTLPSGYSYDGHWFHGKRSGHGVMTDDAGRRYEGEWHDGRQHGTGRMMYTNGDEYSGKWRAGVPHGKGQLTNKGGAVAVGVWIDGKRQTHWLKEPAMRLWSRLDLRRHLRTHFGQLALLMMTVHVAKNWIGPFVAYYLGLT